MKLGVEENLDIQEDNVPVNQDNVPVIQQEVQENKKRKREDEEVIVVPVESNKKVKNDSYMAKLANIINDNKTNVVVGGLAAVKTGVDILTMTSGARLPYMAAGFMLNSTVAFGLKRLANGMSNPLASKADDAKNNEIIVEDKVQEDKDGIDMNVEEKERNTNSL